jgi:hypothetical protein
MDAKRMGVSCGCVGGLVLMIGAVQAGAAGSTQVLKFENSAGVQTAIGFNANSNTPPPIGASQVISVVIRNAVPQFGKPAGAAVGHVHIICTVLSVGAQAADGTCNAIAHVPNGYFTFGGDGLFQNNRVNLWAITGGVGPYAFARGEIVVTNYKNGSSTAVVTYSTT